MADMYRNNMAIGLPYEASPSTVYVPTVRKSAESRRFHPYTDFSSGNRRISHEARSTDENHWGLLATNYFPAAIQPVSAVSECQLPTGAGSLLGNTTYCQDYLPFNSNSQLVSYSQTFNLKTLQNLCDPVSETGTSFSKANEKDRSHPFYWRKRAEPAEGMTRTRDKYRVVYTDKQRKGLENEYKTNKFITTERKAEISRRLDLSERQIKIWFQNRRAKERRDSRKSKYLEQMDSEIKPEDDNNTDDRLANANFPTSCRFAESSAQSEEKTVRSGQCFYMSQLRSGCIATNRFHSSESRLTESIVPRMSGCPVSPSGWTVSTECGFIPPLNISPITGNTNASFSSRL